MPPKQTEIELSDDDFDEIISDDEDAKPNKNDPVAVLRGSLTKPRHTQTSTKHLHDLIHFGVVDLEPEYQRAVVWPEAKMTGLIGSLFMNYYIPPIIFAVHTNESGEEFRTCIDGKQRCSSIVYFMDGKIPFISTATKEKYWYTNPGSRKSGMALPPSLKTRFDQIQIQSVEYDQIPDEQQRDIFQRVQMGVALSAPEKLQAIPGPWSKWIIQLQKKYIAEEGTLGTSIVWDQGRARPFQALTAFIMLALDTTEAISPTSAVMTSFLTRSDAPDLHFQRKAEKALAEFVNISVNHYQAAFQSVPGKEKVAPVEFWFTCLLIYTRMAYLSVPSLARQIGEMRAHIRRIYIDIRANTRTIKDLHAWLAKVPKKRSADEIPAAEDFDDMVDEVEQRAIKRSRRQEEEDPTYRDTIIPREIAPDPAARTTRNAAAAGTSKAAPVKNLPASTLASSSTSKPRQALPTQAPVRPPPNPMDRTSGPAIHLPSSFGQMVSQSAGINPYAIPYQAGPVAQGQGQGQGLSLPSRTGGPNNTPNYYSPAQALAIANYLQSGQQGSQQPQGNRWASR